ncbi:N-acetylglucosamine-1-phosphodiester alpha-N-acetylglucosaminidase isoform X2 [Syngnathoides biaculeatus]|uniref:N-acetylglucosamine-1-phosphodiester alpha-N-acetylglucosaminidase isoform X2 n=1 Tax=Syngnathoides biaculeatus TaxID=300417 RepID=UPI002ADDE663|nr:N-acetylglucosamine-1-phosphodiester alpha-N-acetylglucosaminidase isoform X2 [Syngnathoides biaculeatus]
MATIRVDVVLSWLILCLCGRLWTSQTPADGVSTMENVLVTYMDILLPYTDDPSTPHSHRQVRDCQPSVHGNRTHEIFPASNRSNPPAAEAKLLIYKLPERVVTGHFTVVHDPLRTLSVLEPGRPGGCGNSRLATVEETSKAAGCLYAQNAGYFNTHTGQCLGNLVSDGRMVQDSGGVQNAQFGIRRDGTLVTGYLSQEEVLDQFNPFVQLITGVVWLLRNGEVYIESSLTAECDKTQETGSFRYFTEVISARTALGHDAEGRVILLQVDGRTGESGMSLFEMAVFLKNNGVINAINLDGGGSSTFVSNGSLASYPSDECKTDKRWRCARAVSTVLCVHPQRCHPSDCGAHGVCAASGCLCDAGWTGKNCSQECLLGFYGKGCNQTCSCMNGGSCHHVHGGCSCAPGFTGKSCEECVQGFHGDGCNLTCSCMNGGSCHHVHDNCSCTPGFTGKTCDEECLPGFYGDGCNHSCSCMNGGSCHHVHGGCSCAPGFIGKTCEECLSGYYGDGCNQTCSCMNGGSCHHVHDNCTCTPGYIGKTCGEECLPGFYGDGCTQTCSCMNGGSCHHIHGGCICSPGFTGISCEEECLPGFYGNGCNQTCSCMNGGSCHHVHGGCRCTPGFIGKTCEEECLPDFYGDGCNQKCSCSNGGSCHHVSGSCSCSPGFTGESCEKECLEGFYGDGCNQTCSCMNGGSCHHIHGSCSCAPGFTGKTCEEDERSQTKEQEPKTHLTERTWLTLTIILSVLLLLSLLALAMQLCRFSLPTRTGANYTYLPLTALDGGDSNEGGPGRWDRDCSTSLELI